MCKVHFGYSLLVARACPLTSHYFIASFLIVVTGSKETLKITPLLFAAAAAVVVVSFPALKDANLIRSPRVAKAMQATDRGFYTPHDAYEDR